MSNWDTDFNIGDRVTVDVSRTTRDARTHQIIVEHGIMLGEIHSIDFDGNTLGIRFDAGHTKEIQTSRVRKMR